MNNLLLTIKRNEKLKSLLIKTISSSHHLRPRWWVRNFVNPFVHKREKGSIVRRSSRMDVFPWKHFHLGKRSMIEDFAVINNGAGDVIIGDNTRVGIGTVIIGPVTIGNNVGIGQNAFISGFNHIYKPDEGIPEGRELQHRPVVIGDDSHIGANAVIVPGVQLGKWVIVGAGSVVTKDIDSYSLVVGNPAKVIKKYNKALLKWEKV